MKKLLTICVCLLCLVVVSGKTSVKDSREGINQVSSCNELMIINESHINKAALDPVLKRGGSTHENISTNKSGYYVLVLILLVVMLLVIEECVVFFSSNNNQ